MKPRGVEGDCFAIDRKNGKCKNHTDLCASTARCECLYLRWNGRRCVACSMLVSASVSPQIIPHENKFIEIIWIEHENWIAVYLLPFNKFFSLFDLIGFSASASIWLYPLPYDQRSDLKNMQNSLLKEHNPVTDSVPHLANGLFRFDAVDIHFARNLQPLFSRCTNSIWTF